MSGAGNEGLHKPGTRCGQRFLRHHKAVVAIAREGALDGVNVFVQSCHAVHSVIVGDCAAGPKL